MAKEKKETTTYVNAPLHIFKDFQKNPITTVTKFLNIGICRFAKKISYNHEEVLRQLFYEYKHNRNQLNENLIDFIESTLLKYGFTADSEIFDFKDSTFDVARLVEMELSSYLNSDITDDSIWFYQLKQAKVLLNVSFNSSIMTGEYIKYLREERSFTDLYGKDASVSLTITMLFDFMNEKKQHELDLFSAYFAIKSIQGTSEYCKTNKSFIKMRMLGAKSKKVLTDHLKVVDNKWFHKRIDNRYQIDKIIEQLLVKGFLQSKIGRDRYLYLSTQLSYDLLPQAIAAANKPKILKNKEQAAKELLNSLLSQ